MTTDNEQTTGMGVAQRFVKAAEELHLSGGRLYRDGIVANEQVQYKRSLVVHRRRRYVSCRHKTL